MPRISGGWRQSQGRKIARPQTMWRPLVLRDLEAKDEANRVITVYAPPETASLVPGALERSEGESDKRYARRKKLVDELMSIPDKGR